MKNINIKSYLLILVVALLSCQDEVELPQIHNGLQLIPAGGIISAGNVSLNLPINALDQVVSFQIDDQKYCEYKHTAEDIYFFRCMYALEPNGTSFSQPVTLTITEDKYWLRPVNELGISQDIPFEKLRLYRINTQSGGVSEVPDAKVIIEGNQVKVSGKIRRLGNYQIGIPRSEIQFVGGTMIARLTNVDGVTKTMRISSNQAASGGSTLLTEYLMNKSTTNIYMSSTPQNFADGNSIIIVSKASKTGTHEAPAKIGENACGIFYTENGIKYGVAPFLGENTTIRFTKYEKIGGIVEGTFETIGLISPTDEPVLIQISFSVRRIL